MAELPLPGRPLDIVPPALNPVAPPQEDPVTAALRQASEQTGVPFEHLLTTAKRESSLNPNAKAPTSSATGLFQHIDQTWLGLMHRHGAKYGAGDAASSITRDRNGRYKVKDGADSKAILGLRTNPYMSAVMGAELTKENSGSLQKALGRDPTPGELYAGHFLGAGGASSLIKAAERDPTKSAASLFPKAAQANERIFYNRDGTARTVSDVLGHITRDHGNLPAGPSPQGGAPVQAQASAGRPLGRTERPLTRDDLYLAELMYAPPAPASGPMANNASPPQGTSVAEVGSRAVNPDTGETLMLAPDGNWVHPALFQGMMASPSSGPAAQGGDDARAGPRSVMGPMLEAYKNKPDRSLVDALAFPAMYLLTQQMEESLVRDYPGQGTVQSLLGIPAKVAKGALTAPTDLASLALHREGPLGLLGEQMRPTFDEYIANPVARGVEDFIPEPQYNTELGEATARLGSYVIPAIGADIATTRALKDAGKVTQAVGRTTATGATNAVVANPGTDKPLFLPTDDSRGGRRAGIGLEAAGLQSVGEALAYLLSGGKAARGAPDGDYLEGDILPPEPGTDPRVSGPAKTVPAGMTPEMDLPPEWNMYFDMPGQIEAPRPRAIPGAAAAAEPDDLVRAIAGVEPKALPKPGKGGVPSDAEMANALAGPKAGAPAKVADSKKAIQVADTRGQGRSFHGTGAPIERLENFTWSSMNYYGQGFYTTDAADIGFGYARSRRTGKTPTLYEIEETRPDLRFYDMEQPVSDETKTMLARVDDYLADAVDYLSERGRTPNLREIYDEVRDVATGDGYSADSIQEIFQAVRENFEDAGFAGLSHTGGLRTNKKPHRVKIYFNPEEDVRLKQVDPEKVQPSAITPPAPAKTKKPDDGYRQAYRDLLKEAKASGTVDPELAADMTRGFLKRQQADGVPVEEAVEAARARLGLGEKNVTPSSRDVTTLTPEPQKTAVSSGQDVTTPKKDVTLQAENVAGPAVAGGARAVADDADAKLQAKSARRAPRKTRYGDRPQSLLEFIGQYGGIKGGDRGDLKAMGADRWHRDGPFRRKLVNEKGVDIDYVREAAEQEGFIGGAKNDYQTTTVDDLLEAIRQEVGGEPVFAVKDETQAAQWREAVRAQRELDRDAAQVEAIRSTASGLGVDDLTDDEMADIAINTRLDASPDEVEAAIESYAIRHADEHESALEAEFDIPWEEKPDVPLPRTVESPRGTDTPEGQPVAEGSGSGASGRREDRGQVGETGRPQSEEGGQAVIPGAERISDKELAERRTQGRKSTDKAQQDVGDTPLFDTGARAQTDLVDMAKAAPKTEAPAPKPAPEAPKKTSKPELLSSAPTLRDLKGSVTRFYAGEQRGLKPAGDGLWAVTRPDGTVIDGVQVRKARGRYRFEGVEKAPEPDLGGTLKKQDSIDRYGPSTGAYEPDVGVAETAKGPAEQINLTDTLGFGKRLDDGSITTADQVREEFRRVRASEAAIRDELNTWTKKKLTPLAGIRYKNERKSAMVEAAYDNLLKQYAMRNSYTWSPLTESHTNALARLLDTLTDEDVAKYLADRKSRFAPKATTAAKDEVRVTDQDPGTGKALYVGTGAEGKMFTLVRQDPQPTSDPRKHSVKLSYVKNLSTDRGKALDMAREYASLHGIKKISTAKMPMTLEEIKRSAPGERTPEPQPRLDPVVEARKEPASDEVRRVDDMTDAEVLARAGLKVDERVARSGKTWWAVTGDTLTHKDMLTDLGLAAPRRIAGKWTRGAFDENPTKKIAAALQGDGPSVERSAGPDERVSQNLPGMSKQEAAPVLKRAKLEVREVDGTYFITGKTFDHKGLIKSIGGRWNGARKAWAFDDDPTGQLGAALTKHDEATGSRGSAADDADVERDAAEAERLAKLRKSEDARTDERGSIGNAGRFVSKETAALIQRGEKFGIPQEVLKDQVEDVGLIVSAFKRDKPLFMLANEAGTGKTFVLGGAIRELRAAGQKRFVYVTQSEDLIDQIRGDLANFGLDGVEFVTYSKLSADPQGVVLLFDESHNIKNIAGGTARATKGAEMMAKAKMTVMASATPYQNPVEAGYLGATGIFDSAGGHTEWAKAYGAAVRRRKYFDYELGKKVVEETIYWPGRGKKEDGAAARQWFVKQGVFTQRNMKIDPKKVAVNFSRADVAPKYVKHYKDVEAAYETAMRAFVDDDGRALDAKIAAEISRHRENTIKRTLEAAKVPAAIAAAKDLLKQGRNVVIFVETKADRHIGRFKRAAHWKDNRLYTFSEMEEMWQDWKAAKDMAWKSGERAPPKPFAEFIYEIAKAMDHHGLDFELPSVADELAKALPDVGIYTGAVTPKKARENKEAFLAGKKRVLIATMAKGGTGLSLHDTKGTRPTTQLNMNLPWAAWQVDQVSARVARYGLASDAEIRWLFAANIPWESQKLAPRVGGRMSDMGAIVKGVEVRAAERLLKDFDFTGTVSVKQKSGSQIDLSDRVDDVYAEADRLEASRMKADDTSGGFFATPLPVSAFMARVAGIKAGDRVLEPSAGTGNLLRFVGPDVDVTAIERRRDNADELRANLSRRSGPVTVEQADFLKWLEGNDQSFDVVLMNPPFERVKGIGPQDAVHVQHAYQFLRPGGRLVAIMGEGVFFRSTKQEVAFREWLDDVGATILKMPEGVFKKSGTGVSTRMVIIDRDTAGGTTTIDLREMQPGAEQSWGDRWRAHEDIIPTRFQRAAEENRLQGAGGGKKPPDDPPEAGSARDQKDPDVNGGRSGEGGGPSLYSNPFFSPDLVRKSAAEMITAAVAGWEQDEEGGWRYNPAKGLLWATGVSLAIRLPIKGRTLLYGDDSWGMKGLEKGIPALLKKVPGGKFFHPTNGVSDDLYAKVQRMKRAADKGRWDALKMAREIQEKFTPEERALASNWREGVNFPDEFATGSLTDIPAFVRAMADNVGTVVDDMGRRLADLGMLDDETIKRGAGTYLHRYYLPKIKQSLSQFLKRNKSMKISGSYGKRRGYMKEIRGDYTKGETVYEMRHATEDKVRHVKAGERDRLLNNGWYEAGEFTVEAVRKDGVAAIWRDWTPIERKNMGEVRDIAYRFGRGMMEATHDLALGKLFEDISLDPRWASADEIPGWHQVPKSNVPGTKIRKYGKLGGMWVHPEVKDALRLVRRPWAHSDSEIWNSFYRKYAKALGAWKVGKTAYNPATHLNNVMGNVSLWMLAIDANPADMARRLWQAAKDGKRVGTGANSYRTKIWDEAQEAGLSLDVEINMGDEFQALSRDLQLEGGSVSSKWAKFFDAYMSNPMTRLYGKEDQIFKLAMYRKMREEGMSPEEAVRETHRWFFDYRDVPLGVQAMRDWYAPFITYTYKILPALARVAASKPHRAIAAYGVLSGISMGSYAYLYPDRPAAREDYERHVLPQWVKGKNALAADRAIRLPWNEVDQAREGEERGLFLNSRYFLPGGDIFDMIPPENSPITVPYWPQALGGTPLGGHPLVQVLAGAALGKDLFFGKDIYPYPDVRTDDPDSPLWQKAANWSSLAGFMAYQVLPPIIPVPGSVIEDRFGNALVGEGLLDPESPSATFFNWTGMDYAGRKEKLIRAFLRTGGVKIESHNPDEAAEWMEIRDRGRVFDARAKARNIGRNEGKSEADLERQIKAMEAEIQRMLQRSERTDNLKAKAEGQR